MTKEEYKKELDQQLAACDYAASQNSSMTALVVFLSGLAALAVGTFGGFNGTEWGWPVAILGLFGLSVGRIISGIIEVNSVLIATRKDQVRHFKETLDDA